MRASPFAGIIAAALALALPAIAAVPTIASGTDYALALSKDGKVYAWGWDTHGQLGSGRTLFSATPQKVANVPPAVWIDGGATHVAVVDWLGKVWTWGSDDAGQLGRRSITDPTRPGQVTGVTGAARVTASRNFTAVLKTDGTVVVWGTFAGQLRSPQQVTGLSGIVDIRSGSGHIVALKGDGTVWTAGSNDYGELGDGTAGAARAAASQVAGLSGITKVGAGACGSMAVRADKTVVAWGRAACAATPARYTPTPIAGLANVVDVAGGFDHSHAVLADGSVRVWDNSYVPATRAGFLAVSQIAVDTQLETIALLANGTVVVSGNNDFGQLGQGNTDPIAGISLTSLLGISQVATAHTGDGAITQYARASNGDVYAWGAGLVGQLGGGAALVTSVPAPVAGLPEIVKVAAGDASAYAVDINGFAWAWGDNTGYALGDGTASPRSTPVKIAGLTGVKDVAAGRGFALFIMADNSVQLLGGVLGPGTNAPPALVAGLANIATVAARGANAYAIDSAGAVMAWGSGTDARVGDGTTTDRNAPVPIAAFNKPVTSISAGARHALARTNDNTVWSWGTDSGNGVLGDGVAGAHVNATPSRIVGIAGATDVAAGETHSLALLASGLASSWGTSALGAGSTDSRNLPGPVIALDHAARIAAGRYASWALDVDGAASGWGGAIARAGAGGFGATTGDGTFVFRDTPVFVLRDGAQGNLDSADWFLDIDATAANTPHATPAPAMVPVARGMFAAHSVSLDAGIHFRAADNGRKVGTYILGYVPPSFLAQPPVSAAMAQDRIAALVAASAPVMVQLTPAGWITVDGLLAPFSQGAVSGNGALESVLNGVDPAAIAGARFCIGYGEDGGTMLANGSIAQVIAIEPAAAAPSAIPCVTAGVYLDGPRQSASGTPVTFQATVVGNAPTGTVRFTDAFHDATAAIALVPAGNAAARASTTLTGLGLGWHPIGVSYSGGAGNSAAGAALPLLHLARQAPVVGSFVDIELSGPPSALAGAEVTLTATVIGKQPTGTVQFLEIGTPLGAPAPIINGVATLRIATLAPGLHQLNGVYSGDAANLGRPSPDFTLTVGSTPGPDVAISVSTHTPQIGTPVTLTATVDGTPTAGSVQFYDRDLLLGAPITVSSGKAQLTLDSLASGQHLLAAQYIRDAFNRWNSSALALDVALAIDAAYPDADADGDGIPNPVEKDVGRNPFAMDNDVFADAGLFPMQQYRDFLGREADTAGLNYWSNAIATGALTRAQVTESFFFSPEFQGTVAPVVRLYFAYFLRIPDYDGLLFWVDKFRTGTPLQAISDAFAGSPEFAQRYGALNNGGFVQLVYNNVLGRAPDNPGYAFWIGQLNNGALTRGGVMTGFSESPEYRSIIGNEVYTTMMYMGMLRRGPEADGFAFWVNYLDTGHSGLALINGFIASGEYRSRFLP